jgi:hypothetical protein
MKHDKHEEKTITIRTQHVVTLTSTEIEAALAMYVAAKTGISESAVVSREPAYFQARSSRPRFDGIHGGVCGPLDQDVSCVQLVFTTGDK